MEFKVIVYIIIGVLYFLYTISKKAEEKRKISPVDQEEEPPPVAKPVSPPVENPMEEILREIQRKRAGIEKDKKIQITKSKPVQVKQQKKSPREILIHEVKQKGQIEGSSKFEPVYDRYLTDEEKIYSSKIQLEEESLYKIQGIDEEKTEDTAESGYNFDARQGFIGRVILERKY
jgi:hypothetical protein